jgi:DNA-binding winged helix-turn-helix (wHTH) protein
MPAPELLRKVLGDDRNGNSFIQTVPRRGYKAHFSPAFPVLMQSA